MPASESNAICAGRNCQNAAVMLLKLRYLNLKGGFCVPCSEGLIADGLVIPEEKEREPARGQSSLVSSVPIPQVSAQGVTRHD